MSSEILRSRLDSVLKMINANYSGVANSPSAVKGNARASFINSYLEQVVPQSCRISTSGEIIDSQGASTGELDIIIENGYFPNIPIVGEKSSRLFFAEGVAAVIEVKSNLQGQWDEAMKTGEKLSKIERKIEATLATKFGDPLILRVNKSFNNPNLPKMEKRPQEVFFNKVPYFLVGYKGWEKTETLQEKFMNNRHILSGVLQLDNGFFICGEECGGVTARGPMCLMAFINAIYESYNYIKNPNTDLLSYAR
ncbi:DUF6602 domain-containing protein [Serratia quinivorans]|uniref:DUF6602 domain-containing protein n=1 Tax=Serratia quinivorans TaxID=137545 RepID=UPI001C4642EC|nr:DUF6602 domain-containing protein [Serratia quinivorans]MBV6691689.1 hypothetical protein [Serratia quinivorans]